jgi:hypothetical protein
LLCRLLFLELLRFFVEVLCFSELLGFGDGWRPLVMGVLLGALRMT